MTYLIERNTVSIDIKHLVFDEKGSLSCVSANLVRLKLSCFKYPLDIGSWCYTTRRRKNNSPSSEDYSKKLVDINSLRLHRVPFIEKYLEYLQHHISIGKSENSIKTITWIFRTFIAWCDERYVSALDSRDNYINATYYYTEHLIDSARKSQMNINTAAMLQGEIIAVGKHIYSDEYGEIFKSTRKISRSLQAIKITEPPDKNKVKSALKLYSKIFHELSSFVLDFEKFPKRLDFDHGFFWFFPTQLPFAGPLNVDMKTQGSKNYTAYDYVNGKVRNEKDISELIEKHDSNQYNARKAREIAITTIEKANSDNYNIHRIKAASMAFQAFAMLFSANTGMNLSQMINLEWSDNYQTSHDRQGFRAIKYRANGKEVQFYIEAKFIPLFKKALKLRDYLIGGAGRGNFSLLFFSLSRGRIYPLSKNLSYDFNRRLAICFNYNNKISTRMWRAHKSSWLLNNTDIHTTSLLLQNSPGTVHKHYSECSESQAEVELTDFFFNLRENIVISNYEKTTETAIGQCVSQDSPTEKDPRLSHVKPDCKTPEGCLFCSHYRIHADTIDYRKLLSLRYLLNQTRHLANNHDHFGIVVNPIIEKIDYFVYQLEESGKISTIEQEVIKQSVEKNEELSDYWRMKLQLLDDLEII